MLQPGRLALGLSLVLLLLGRAATAQSAEQPAAPSPDFRQEGSTYYAAASGEGATATEAEETARGAALRLLFVSLGKDRLFAEVFIGSPPLGLGFKADGAPTRSGEKGVYRARMTLSIDDESLRIVERGPYLAAATSLLDQAELASARAEEAQARAEEAQTRGELGEALGAYGMAQDGASSGLALIDGLEDSSIFSTKGKRTVTDLRRSLGTAGETARAGIDRVKQAEAALSADDSAAEASRILDLALASADAGLKLLDDAAPLLDDVGAAGPERLKELRERLSLARRTLADSSASLERAAAALPAGGSGGPSYLADKVDFARRRLATADASLEGAWARVDLEIRDPAARREARAQAVKWALFHVPKEYLQIRAYLPFEVEAGDRRGFESAPLDLRIGAEGAFPSGEGGIWIRSLLATRRLSLDRDGGGSRESTLSQSLDLGFWGRRLWFIGYGWDWARSLEGAALPAASYVRLGLGGISSDGAGFPRADWNIALSYQLPYEMGELALWNLLNAGLEAQFRLGTAGFLELMVAQGLHRNSGEAPLGYDSILAWSVGIGFHLPPPFSFGVEYGGSMASPLYRGDEIEYGNPGGRESFRLFLGYSL